MSLTELQRQREAAEVVHEVVAAMRAMSAGRVQRAQQAVVAARTYHEVVLRALGAVEDEEHLTQGAPVDHPAGLLVMTSEQGLCGAFNQDILAFATRRRAELQRAGPVHLFVVGRRGWRKLAAQGITADETFPAATSVRGLRDLVKQLASSMAAHYIAGRIGSLSVIFSAYRSVSQQLPSEAQLLPLDQELIHRARGDQTAAHYRYLPPQALVTGLISEYVFISLYRIAAESYASEQASRLVAMDAATRNSAELLEDLRRRERREQQAQVTREVLELVSARFADRH